MGDNPYDRNSDYNMWRYHEDNKTRNWTPGFSSGEIKLPTLNFGGSSGSNDSSSSSIGASGGGGLGLIFLVFIGYCIFSSGDSKPSKPHANDTRAGQQTAPLKGFAVVTTENLNLRSCASSDCAVVAIMPRNLRAQILGQLNNGWLELSVDGTNQKFHGYANGVYPFMKILENP